MKVKRLYSPMKMIPSASVSHYSIRSSFGAYVLQQALHPSTCGPIVWQKQEIMSCDMSTLGLQHPQNRRNKEKLMFFLPFAHILLPTYQLPICAECL